MKEKTYDILFGVSLAISGGASVIIVLSRAGGWPLPVFVIKALGILGLAALPVLVFSMLKKLGQKK